MTFMKDFDHCDFSPPVLAWQHFVCKNLRASGQQGKGNCAHIQLQNPYCTILPNPMQACLWSDVAQNRCLLGIQCLHMACSLVPRCFGKSQACDAAQRLDHVHCSLCSWSAKQKNKRATLSIGKTLDRRAKRRHTQLMNVQARTDCWKACLQNSAATQRRGCMTMYD